MSDYIKRDERKYWLKCLVDDILGDDGLCEGCKYVDHGSCYKCRRTGANEILKIIDTDVAPVRHGRWIVGDSLPMHDIAGNLSWGNWYTCNQCEFKTYAIERHITQYNYCPNCGAKMDR